MKIKSNFDLKYLEASLEISGSGGACFYRSTALVLDLASSVLAIGTLPGVTREVHLANPRKSPTPFLHCWVEWSGQLIVPTDLELHDFEIGTYDMVKYYEHNSVRDVHHVDRRNFKALAERHGWCEHFLTGEPLQGGDFVRTLLTAIGVPFEVNARKTVVPIGTTLPDYALRSV